MKTGKFLIAAIALLSIGLWSCKKDVESVSIRPEAMELQVGETYQMSAAVLPSDADQTVEWTSSRTSVATVSETGLVTAVAEGTCDITVYAADKSAVCHLTVVARDPNDPTDPNNPNNPTDPTDPTNPTGTDNGHGYVDLGLSVMWATCNVGASSPQEYGNYYAWGEVSIKSVYDWSTYAFCNGSETTLTKYNTNSEYGTVDNRTTLELSDDVAHVVWGGDWRMPTAGEMRELVNSCTWEWTNQNNVNGYRVYGPNGNTIFLPAGGCRNEGELVGVGTYGGCWVSSLYADRPYYAQLLCFLSYDSLVSNVSNDSRYYGLTVRPVRR